MFCGLNQVTVLVIIQFLFRPICFKSNIKIIFGHFPSEVCVYQYLGRPNPNQAIKSGCSVGFTKGSRYPTYGPRKA